MAVLRKECCHSHMLKLNRKCCCLLRERIPVPAGWGGVGGSLTKAVANKTTCNTVTVCVFAGLQRVYFAVQQNAST
jgi:hypothetical protein